MDLNKLKRVRQNSKRDLLEAIAKIGEAGSEQGLSARTKIVNYKQSYSCPAECQSDQSQSQTPASLQEQRPQAKHEDDAGDLFLAGQTQHHEKKKPERLACI